MLTKERISELFELRDGILFWKVKKGRVKAGSAAGSIDDKGYKTVGVDGKWYKCHRIIFCMEHGFWPENHIDRNRINNDPSNLREVSRQCNNRNTVNRKDCSSGVKGVNWYKPQKKWKATVRVNKKQIHICYHEDFTEAVAHRLAAEQAENWDGCDSSSSAFKYMQEYLIEQFCAAEMGLFLPLPGMEG